MFESILDNLGTELVWQLVLTGFALIGAVVITVLLVQRRPVPAAAVPLPAGLVALSIVVLARVAVWGWATRAEDTLLLGVTTHAGVRLVGVLSIGPVVALLLASAAFVGARDSPRRPALAGAGFVGALLCAAVVGGGGWVEGNVLFAGVRAAAYAGVGAGVAVALLAGGPEDGPGRQAAAGAAMLFPVVVAVGELSASGMAEFLVPMQLAHVPPERWAEAVDWMYLQIDREWTYSAGALAVATGVAALGALCTWPTPQRVQGAVGAVVWAALAWGMLAVGPFGAERMDALSVLCTGELPVDDGAAPGEP